MKSIAPCCVIIPLLISGLSHASDNQIQPRSFFKDTTIWPSTNIPVCWENQTSQGLNNTSRNRGLVRSALQQSWEAASLVRFTDWSSCPAGYFNGVRISLGGITASHGLGTEVLNIHPSTGKRGVTLDFNLTYDSVPSNDLGFPKNTKERCALNGKNLEQCIQFVAVHEFGHVLGLSHEHNRSDDGFPAPCKADDLTSNNVHGNTTFTDYDPESIMNYCRQNYYGDSSLSVVDKVSVKAYYGRIPTFTAETLKLDIPRLIYQGTPYEVTLKYGNDGRFTLLYAAPTNNQSSAEVNFSNSAVTLPLLRYMIGGKVVDLWNSTLRQDSDGKFSITSFNIHPDTQVQ